MDESKKIQTGFRSVSNASRPIVTQFLLSLIGLPNLLICSIFFFLKAYIFFLRSFSIYLLNL